MAKAVAFLGDACVDVQVAGVQALPGWGEDAEAQGVSLLPGGSCANAARHLASELERAAGELHRDPLDRVPAPRCRHPSVIMGQRNRVNHTARHALSRRGKVKSTSFVNAREVTSG